MIYSNFLGVIYSSSSQSEQVVYPLLFILLRGKLLLGFSLTKSDRIEALSFGLLGSTKVLD